MEKRHRGEIHVKIKVEIGARKPQAWNSWKYWKLKAI